VSLREKAQKGLKYDWQISGAEAPGNRTQGTGLAIGFTVDTVASLQISLTLTDTTQPGQCRADTSFAIPVGDERVRLPLKTLEYDPITPEKRLNWASWLLLALAALGAGWYWWRWMRRKAPEPDWPVPNTPDMAVETASSDRPPYYIPWREADKHLRPAREQYRLADALRLRQQTEDQTLDFMATLRATLERGGYPTLRYRTRTRPTEYLFMVDEQLPGHHQARLFRHVAETLRGQDVVLDAAHRGEVADEPALLCARCRHGLHLRVAAVALLGALCVPVHDVNDQHGLAPSRHLADRHGCS
jgi:hypothetical protein